MIVLHCELVPPPFPPIDHISSPVRALNLGGGAWGPGFPLHNQGGARSPEQGSS